MTLAETSFRCPELTADPFFILFYTLALIYIQSTNQKY